jgi:hypothetical protein
MRKHDEVIRAWLDGKTIQRYNAFDDVWVSSVNEWLNPKYFYEFEWRVKPEARTIVIPSIIKLKNVTASFDEDKREILVKFEEAGEDSDGE